MRWPKKRRSKPDKPNQEFFRMVCSDCGKTRSVTRIALIRAARLRCTVCGGPLNKKREA